MASKLGFRVGNRVRCPPFDAVGVIREFGGVATTYRGVEYAAVRVEWSDGQGGWVSAIDLVPA